MNTPSRPPASDLLIGSGAGDLGIENRSRSGRVRKKNTLLAEYESLDNLEKGKIGRRKSERRDSNSSAKATLKFADLDEPSSLKRKPPPKKEGGNKRAKLSSSRKNDLPKKNIKLVQKTPPRLDQIYMGGHEEGDLQMDLPPEFQDDNDMPILGGEEIIDGTLLGEEDSGRDAFEHLNSSNSKLKSQAQSTYMMEKTIEKNKKLGGSAPGGTPGKAKAARKDKGTPRVTAYMLWMKDQRPILAKKNPSLDFASMNRKLGDLWGTVPQNQKKMWKNKAVKIMRKNSNVMENIKNSGPLPPPKGKKPRGRPRLHLLGDQDLSNGDDDIIMPVKKSSPPVPRKPGGNFLPQSEKTNAKKTPVNSAKKSPTLGKHFRQENSVSKPPRNFKGVTNGVKVSNARNHVASKAKKNNISPPSASYLSSSSNKKVSPRKEDVSSILKPPNTTPLDVAAHFALLGESLSVIGQRLKDVEGQTVSGSLSVLLDSLLCATGPLLCLCQQVPELNCIPPEQLSRLLDNIAYVMPGL